MARKRMIDPEFWSDEEIGQWSYEARLFYIGLWNFADDLGRFKAHPALLKSQIFPYDQKFNIESLKKELNHKVQWYEVDGLQYGYLRNFNKHQRIDRPQDSKLPKPPPFDEHSTNIRRTLVPNIREVNIREEKRREVTHPPSVCISKDEEKAFIGQYGQKAFKDYVSRLNDYSLSHPHKFRVYKDHAAVLRQWARKDGVKVSPAIITEKVYTPDPIEQAKVAALIKATKNKIGVI